MRRSIGVLAVLGLFGAAVWLLSNRASVRIVVERGGHAYVQSMFSRAALPETLFVRAVGSHTVIRIANHDTVRHHLGLFDVEPGDTRNFTVAYPGTFGGFCSTHPASKKLVYVVE